jgi:hypothetical protein
LEQRLLDVCLYGPDSAKQYKLFQDLPSYDDEAFRADYEWRYETLFLQCANQMKSGNMLFGIPMDYPASVETANTADTRGVGLMAEAMFANFPALQTAEIDRAWGRVVPFTSDSLPVIDFVPEFDGLLINSGQCYRTDLRNFNRGDDRRRKDFYRYHSVQPEASGVGVDGEDLVRGFCPLPVCR